MGVCGNYVMTFAEASHALPAGMHMNADYPFMIARIEKIEGGMVTIRGNGGKTETFEIKKDQRTKRECGFIYQSSAYEVLFRQKPSRWQMQPFKDNQTPAFGESQHEHTDVTKGEQL